MKVLITRKFFDEDIAYLRRGLLEGIDLIIPSDYSEMSLTRLIPQANVLLGNLITENLLLAAKKLAFIQIPWTGIDFLNFDLLSRFNIIVCNSHSNSLAVAEHAVSLMLDAAKKLSYHDRLLREGRWNKFDSELVAEVTPFSMQVSESRVGIIGFGSIGEKIYTLLKGFNCRFKIFTREKKSLTTTNSAFFSGDKIIDNLSDISFLFVCVPLTQLTKNMIDYQFLSRMNENAVLINISRGEVINEEDLFNALKNRIIAFAAIDTWYNYPTRNNPRAFPSGRFDYHKLDNIVLSPHRAGYVIDRLPHLDDAIENINRFYSGKALKNIISLTNRY